ncbi:MAG: Rpn family recombination-promoting nuclease/putative transposase, partial [Thermoguttaceae bacterium]
HPVVEQAYEKYRQFNRDERLRSLDEAHQRFLHDLATDIEEAHEKGIEKGIGESKTEIARNMKSEGFDLGIIARMTGLSPEAIRRLD